MYKYLICLASLFVTELDCFLLDNNNLLTILNKHVNQYQIAYVTNFLYTT
jgi:hypothetical protein